MSFRQQKSPVLMAIKITEMATAMAIAAAAAVQTETEIEADQIHHTRFSSRITPATGGNVTNRWVTLTVVA